MDVKEKKECEIMKLGLMTAILGDLSFEEVIEYSAKNDIECLEVACWPNEKASRRYAGVSHIDVSTLNDKEIQKINELLKKANIEISALAYYPNYLDPDTTKSDQYINHLLKVIDAAKALGVNMVTTFIGRDHTKTVNETLKDVEKVWKPIIKYAEDKMVKIAIENCPMIFTEDEWPGGQNIMTSPSNWRKVFEILDSDYLGLNYDPSHFIWQQIDYIKPLYEFKDKLFHVHYKDIKVYKDKLDDVGIMATPLEYMAPKIPGLGDIDWAKYVSALRDINYSGYTCIEVEDKSFEGSLDEVKDSIELSVRYLRNFV